MSLRARRRRSTARWSPCTARGRAVGFFRDQAKRQGASIGDWSANGRNAYWRSRRQDLRLDALSRAAEQMIAAGAKDLAKSMLERGAPLLGYTSETTHASEPGTSEADMKVRLDKLDAVMAKCGAKRPPSVKK